MCGLHSGICDSKYQDGKMEICVSHVIRHGLLYDGHQKLTKCEGVTKRTYRDRQLKGKSGLGNDHGGC